MLTENQYGRGVLLESYFVNMQKNYRRTSMRKCDFNEAALE